jgi:hypothetical protein
MGFVLSFNVIFARGHSRWTKASQLAAAGRTLTGAASVDNPWIDFL